MLGDMQMYQAWHLCLERSWCSKEKINILKSIQEGQTVFLESQEVVGSWMVKKGGSLTVHSSIE